MESKKSKEEYTLDLTLIFQELMKYVWLIVAVVLIFGIIGFTFTKVCMPLEYLHLLVYMLRVMKKALS